MKKIYSIFFASSCFFSSTLVQSFSINRYSVPKYLSSRPRVKSNGNSNQRGLQTSSIVRTCTDASSCTSTSTTSTSLSLSPFDVISTMYSQALMTNPLETKLATGGILAFAGDFIAQSRDDAGYDVKRAGAFVSFDMMYRAMQCALFPEIVRVCDGHHLGSFLQGVDISVLATLEQTMTNQFIIIPLVYYPLFFSLTGYVQGLSIDATIERAQSTIVPLLKRNWTFWLPVQYFQFGYVNEPLQIPFLCVVGLAWTFILSVAAGSVQTYNEANDSVQIYNTAYLEEENMSFYKQNNATLSTV